MKTKILKIAGAAAVALSLAVTTTSCEDWLKEESYDFIQPDDIEDSDKGANQWLTGVYSKVLTMFVSTDPYPMVWEYDSDYLTGPSWAFGTFGAGNFQGNTLINNLWESNYELIHRCNYGAAKVGEMNNVDPRGKTAILGEMKFMII